MKKEHYYNATIQWTGNTGDGTSNYRSYERTHTISIQGKQTIQGSSDPAFRGDAAKYNPEDLLISSLSACHMLWYLHFCSEAGVIVLNYVDNATGIMVETENGSGHFTEVTLHPTVTVAEASMHDKAYELHYKAHTFCFIANSVNFPVKHNAQINIKDY
jgi:organic hydroperoxide reductase OsmC/OhrA